MCLLAVLLGGAFIFALGVFSDLYLGDETFHYRFTQQLHETRSRPLHDVLTGLQIDAGERTVQDRHGQTTEAVVERLQLESSTDGFSYDADTTAVQDFVSIGNVAQELSRHPLAALPFKVVLIPRSNDEELDSSAR